MTSLLGVTFTWTGTPTGMAGISTNGPANVPFGCTPLVPYQYFTFAWSQFGNGCPYEYSYNAIATTCVYTADLYNSQTWGCTWTTSVVSTSTVNGGPTTAPAGVPATVTAPIQWVTITSTGSTVTSTSTSVVDPGAKTVTVVATQGASKLRRDEDSRREHHSGAEKILGNVDSEKPLGEHPADDLVLAALNPSKGLNMTDSWLEDRALCPYTDQIWCGAGCCLDTQSCVGNGAVSCCNGYNCVPFNANAPFVDYLSWSWKGYTQTSTQVSTYTSYSVINPAGSTITITPTSTTNINVLQTKVVTALVTSTGATVTVTNFVGSAGGNQGAGASISGAAFTVTVASQNTASIIPAGGKHSSSNLGLKVGVGVGIPIALAILGALFFLIWRRRKNTDPPAPTNPETSANNPNAGAVGGRPVSELPPYTANAMAAAGLGRKPVGSVSSAPVSPGSDLPERHYSVHGFYPSPSQSPPPGQGTYRTQTGSPPPQSVYTAQGSPTTQHQQMTYAPPAGYEGQEMYVPQHQRMGSTGYPPQNPGNAGYPPQNTQPGTGYPPQNPGDARYPPQNMQPGTGYPPQNPQGNIGYQAQPQEMGYHAQPGHEMYVPHENEGTMGYQAMPSHPGGIRYVNEAETRANVHEM